jgi:cell division protein FtsL
MKIFSINMQWLRAALYSERTACVLLLFAVVVSGIGLAWSKHRARMLYNELEQTSKQQDESQLQWGKLQLEQATWAEHSRVEQIAKERLGLKFPSPEQSMVIQP